MARYMRKKSHQKNQRPWSFYLILTILLIVLIALGYRLFYLETINHEFLRDKGLWESSHVNKVYPLRGSIYDRNGKPLAVTTTLYQLIFDPKVLKQYPDEYQKFDQLNIKDITSQKINEIIQKNPDSRYQVGGRFLTPQQANKIRDQHIHGVYLERQPRSYYPTGEILGPLIGFTGYDNQGQAGLELSFNQKLSAHPWQFSNQQDLKGQAITFLPDQSAEKRQQAIPEDLNLTIDRHIQEITYHALKKGVEHAQGKSGAAVVLNPKNGQILAIASYPSFNPNVFAQHASPNTAERAMVHTVEPGSTIKPFIIARALETDDYQPDTTIDTSPGYYYIGKNKVRDDRNFGKLTLKGIIQKSSNVGVSKVARDLGPGKVGDFLASLGFGQPATLDFPSATRGYLPNLNRLSDFGFATTAYGYGMNTSILQLAHAYSIFGNQGKLCPLSIVKQPQQPFCPNVISPKVADEIKPMLQSVVGPKGTGILATIPGFAVGGKTGTSHRLAHGHYLKNSYNALFAGIAPLYHTKLVIVVWVEDPKRNHYYQYGGVSAAPIFAEIAKQSLQYLGVAYQQSLQKFQDIQGNRQWLLQQIEKN